MLFNSPAQFVVLGALLVIGWLFGFASHPGSKKWKRKLAAQADSFTAYHQEAEDRLRAAQDRVTALEGENATLAARHAEALAATASAPAAPTPAPEPTPEPVPIAAVETAASEIVAESAPAPTPDIDPTPPAAVADTPPEASDAEPESAIAPVTAAPQPETPELVEHTEAAAAPTVEPAEPASAAIIEHVEPAAVVVEHVDPDAGHADASAADPVVPAAIFPMTPTPTEAAPAPIGPAESEMPAKGWFGSTGQDDLTRIRGIDSPMNTRLFGLGVTRFEDIEKLSAEDEMALEQRLGVPVGFIGREQWRHQAALLRAGNLSEHTERFGDSAVTA